MPSEPSRMNLSKARILLVDDSKTAMELLSQALLGFGVTQPRKCSSAEKGRLALTEEVYDLILVDHDMPEEDGLEFCRAVRKDPRAKNYVTPLILLTALPSRETVAKARDAGAHFVVAKPVSPAVLLQRIEWIARSARDFVTSEGYRGPDRHFQNRALPPGVEDRRQDAMRRLQEPGRALSQEDMDALRD